MFQITNNLPWISINGQIIRLVHPFFRYCCFKNSTMSCWEQFWYSLTKNFQITFYLPSIYISMQKKSCWLMQLFLKYSWFKNLKIWLPRNISDNTWPNIYKPSFTFPESIFSCQKSSSFINSYLRYS